MTLGQNIHWIKARRCIRAIPRVWVSRFFEPIFNTNQILMFAASCIGLSIILSNGPTEAERDALASQWTIATEAFGLALLGWAALSLISAPFIVIRNERKLGAWAGVRRVYFEPTFVGVATFTNDDGDKVARIKFNDAEPNSLVSYSIVLDPPVNQRASFYLDHKPGFSDQIFASINPGQGVKINGHGSVRLDGLFAYLSVKLDPETVPVDARVYMHSFEIGKGVTHG